MGNTILAVRLGYSNRCSSIRTDLGLNSADIAFAPGQHRQVEGLRHLADVIFRRQHAVHMAMNSQPAIALRIRGGFVKLAGSLRQLSHQGSVSGIQRRKGHGQGNWANDPLTAIMTSAHPERLIAVPTSGPGWGFRALRVLVPVAVGVGAGVRVAIGVGVAAGVGMGVVVRVAAGVGVGVTWSAPGARAQESPSPNQPVAIDGPAALVPSPCKLVVPKSEAVVQPMKIRPADVPLKNRLGCLSPADAVYGPDGCPVRLCGPTKGVFPLTSP